MAELNRILRVNNKMITVSQKTDLRGKQLWTGFETKKPERNRTKPSKVNFGSLSGKISTIKPVRLQSIILSQESNIPAQTGKTQKLLYSKHGFVLFLIAEG